MCGVLAIFRHASSEIDLPDRAIERMRDTLAHRGPDGTGLWRGAPNAALAHRRLAVVAPGPEGAQPMSTPDGRYVLSYNGELYNDREVRAQLEPLGIQFNTTSDTETFLWALATWGIDAVRRLRGMYAFCVLDVREHRVILGRDPLGVKPLYTSRFCHGGGPEVVVASEPAGILAHPRVSARPDPMTVSAYLSTIRPTLGTRTMFEGIETLRPGEWRGYDLSDADLSYQTHDAGTDLRGFAPGSTSSVRDELTRSVDAHLRADVPMCALLSGGLDSSAICSLAMERLGSLSTYCAGAESDSANDDLSVGARTAAALGTTHTTAAITRDLFGERWPEMVGEQGVPVSTPNEIAINHIARTLRSAGNIVALSGEGADELLAGYEPPLRLAAEFETRRAQDPMMSPSRFHVESNQWVPTGTKRQICNDAFVRAVANDEALFETYRCEWDAIVSSSTAEDADPLAVHLRFQRRMNLENLLRRLDTATMLASVEGRTPFADARFAGWAESLPMSSRLSIAEDGTWRTKACLRDGFARRLPPEVVERPKASFPLPFQGWMADHAITLRTSAFARELFTEAAIATVAAQPAHLWSLAWPMINVAMWGERWWGSGSSSSAEPDHAFAGS